MSESRDFMARGGDDGQTVAAVLRRELGVSWSRAKTLIAGGQVRVNGRPCADVAQRLRPGQRVEVGQSGARREPKRQRRLPPVPRELPPDRRHAPRPPIVVAHEDAHVVVVDKPPGLTTVRHPEEAAEFGRRARKFLPPTLADLLPGALADPRRPVIAVHRLDRDTSGLLVFARTPTAEAHLTRQFKTHTTERRYIALSRGRAADARIESVLVRDRGDGRRGSVASPDGAEPPADGQHAVTHVRVLEELGEFTLVECRLETGRTHQVRIHLGEAGTPLAGERVYDRPLHGAKVPDLSGSPRVFLHAARLGFVHPASGGALAFESPLPADLLATLARVRGAGFNQQA